MKKKPTFSQLKEELEQIVEAMEDSSCPYEKLKELYEKGDGIASSLEELLSSDLEVTVKKIKGA